MAIYTNFNPWQSHSIQELQQVRRAAAKAANQRMVRLERGKSLVSGESLDRYGSVVLTKEYLKNQGRNRFSETEIQKGWTANDYKREISELQSFLNSKTSTVRGQHHAEAARIETFEGKGIKFASNKQFYDFINSDVYLKILKAADSDVLQEIYEKARDKKSDGKAIFSHDDVLNALDEYIKNNSEDVSIKGMMKLFDIEFLEKKKKG
jgi:hypothetical protein